MHFKYLFTALLVTWLSFGGYAQFALDVEGGLNLAKINNLEVEGYSTDNRLGYFVMVTPSYRFGDKMEIRTGVLVNNEGYKLDLKDASSTTAEHSDTYLEFMPVFAYKIANKISLGLGVNYGYRVKMRTRIDKGDWTDLEFRDDDKRHDFGIVGELGLEIDRFWIGTRYIQGVISSTNVYLTNANGQPIGHATAKSRVIQFGIRYTVIE